MKSMKIQPIETYNKCLKKERVKEEKFLGLPTSAVGSQDFCYSFISKYTKLET